MRAGGTLNTIQIQRLRLSVGRAVGPAVDGFPHPVASGRASSFPHSEKAGLSPAPLRSLPILRGQPSQGCRRISFLRLSRSFAANGSPQVFVACDQNPPFEIDPDHVAHLPVLKSAEPVRPVAVIHQ